MAKANNKTVENDVDVSSFINSVEHDQKRIDSVKIDKLMRNITGESPKMWGDSIIGYGRYHYKYESGREGDLMKVGFSPRKQNLTLYIMPGFDRYEELITQLGKHKAGKSCLYINKLDDVNVDILKTLIKKSYDYMTHKYG